MSKPLSPEVAKGYMDILLRYFPASSVDYIYHAFIDNKLHLKVVNARRTKLGDFCGSERRITLNAGLTKEFALFVLLHELAHFDVYSRGLRRVKPHGAEWQQCFADRLMQALSFFPEELQPDIANFASHVPLSTNLSSELDKKLLTYGVVDENEKPLTLNDLPVGSLFVLASRRDQLFKSIEKRRTRWLCLDTLTNSMFLVSGHADVELIEK